MRRFLSNLIRNFRLTNAARPVRRTPRRTTLQLEALENRLVLSTTANLHVADEGPSEDVTFTYGKLQVHYQSGPMIDPGPTSVLHGSGTSGFVPNNQPIAFQANPAQPGKVQALNQRIKFNEFTIKKSVDSASPAFFKNCLPKGK